MSVVTDSPLLVVAAAGASNQAAPVASATGSAGEDQSFARVLQSEKSGTGPSGGPSAVRGGENLPVGGNRLPPTADARSLPPG
ncbi:MAG: hypothetical protein RIC38_02790, partial [Chromatocurvus sp.]